MMSCKLNPHILEYIELVENGIACEEQKALGRPCAKMLRDRGNLCGHRAAGKIFGSGEVFQF